ncbi:hypothetical protein [Burkholderia multivorans]|uniref:hypothetical protein n=1 Tax=Burkholderia multivorans TaxID=87883 RepID=UPI0015E332B3|nr:hypothetical protein [Burkholderia multivorans]
MSYRIESKSRAERRGATVDRCGRAPRRPEHDERRHAKSTSAATPLRFFFVDRIAPHGGNARRFSEIGK